MREWVMVLIRTTEWTPEVFLSALAVVLAFVLVSDDVCRVLYHALRRRFSTPNSRRLSKERRDAMAARSGYSAPALRPTPGGRAVAPGRAARGAARLVDFRTAGDARRRTLDAAGSVLANPEAEPAAGVEHLASQSHRPLGGAERTV